MNNLDKAIDDFKKAIFEIISDVDLETSKKFIKEFNKKVAEQIKEINEQTDL